VFEVSGVVFSFFVLLVPALEGVGFLLLLVLFLGDGDLLLLLLGLSFDLLGDCLEFVLGDLVGGLFLSAEGLLDCPFFVFGESSCFLFVGVFCFFSDLVTADDVFVGRLDLMGDSVFTFLSDLLSGVEFVGLVLFSVALLLCVAFGEGFDAIFIFPLGSCSVPDKSSSFLST